MFPFDLDEEEGDNDFDPTDLQSIIFLRCPSRNLRHKKPSSLI